MTVWGWIIVVIFSLLLLGIVTKVMVEWLWNRRLNDFKKSEHTEVLRMPFERMIKYAYSGLLSAAVVIVTVVSGAFIPIEPIAQEKTLVNAERIGTSLKFNEVISRYRQSRNDYSFFPETAMEDALDSEAGESGESRDYTDTNVQVAGVDEGDVIKTDGYRVFYAPRYYHVVEVLDIEDDHSMTHVETLQLGAFGIDGLYLTDDHLVVVGYRYEEMRYPMDVATINMYYGFYYYRQTASVIVFDKDTLEELYRLETDLRFNDHRLIDDTLYIVSTKWFYEDEEARPMFESTMDGVSKTQYLGYQDMYYFEDMPSASMTVITALDLTDFTHTSQGFIGQTNQIYVTASSIYTFTTIYNYVENVDDYSYHVKTHIAKYHIDSENKTITYQASTYVDGTVEDRYWLDESGDYLRVVTSRSWWGITNRLYVLKENIETDTFDEIALIDENIGHEGERVESVRFHDDYVNIVTYERMDPLYTFDLSNPYEPVMLDNPIEEPGYSEYMHIWDEPEHVIGLGYLDQNSDAVIDGMKLSAYNTTLGSILDTDPYPYEDETGWNYSYTEALYNPKALMVDVELSLFGFPLCSYHYNQTSYEYQYVTSFVVYHIDFSRQDVLGEPIVIELDPTDYYNQVDRGIYIEGYIYTFSANQILSYDLAEETVFETIDIGYEVSE